MDEKPMMRGGPLYWLGRKTWRFWVVMVILGPVLYVATFGPACWICSRMDDPEISTAYLPIGWLLIEGPPEVGGWFVQYAKFGMRPGSFIRIPFDIHHPRLHITR